MANTKSAAYEEALLQELVYAIAHVAHAEQHLIEIDSQLSEPRLSQHIDKLRLSRKTLGEILLEMAKIKGGGGSSTERTASESLWCTLKHLSMAVVHCDECAEKVVRRMSDSLSRGDAIEAKKLVEYLGKIYHVRREAFNMLTSLLVGGELEGEEVEAVRCREDLCVE